MTGYFHQIARGHRGKGNAAMLGVVLKVVHPAGAGILRVFLAAFATVKTVHIRSGQV